MARTGRRNERSAAPPKVKIALDVPSSELRLSLLGEFDEADNDRTFHQRDRYPLTTPSETRATSTQAYR
jgi:hypothetical protein